MGGLSLTESTVTSSTVTMNLKLLTVLCLLLAVALIDARPNNKRGKQGRKELKKAQDGDDQKTNSADGQLKAKDDDDEKRKGQRKNRADGKDKMIRLGKKLGKLAKVGKDGKDQKLKLDDEERKNKMMKIAKKIRKAGKVGKDQDQKDEKPKGKEERRKNKIMRLAKKLRKVGKGGKDQEGKDQKPSEDDDKKMKKKKKKKKKVGKVAKGKGGKGKGGKDQEGKGKGGKTQKETMKSIRALMSDCRLETRKRPEDRSKPERRQINMCLKKKYDDKCEENPELLKKLCHKDTKFYKKVNKHAVKTGKRSNRRMKNLLARFFKNAMKAENEA